MEFFFASWKSKDTHARHLASSTHFAITPKNNRGNDLPRLHLCDASLVQIQQDLKDAPTQREINLIIVKKKIEKRKEDLKKETKKEQHQAREAVRHAEETMGVEIERQFSKLVEMSNAQLRIQLLLWKVKKSDIRLSGSKLDRLQRLRGILLQERQSNSANKE